MRKKIVVVLNIAGLSPVLVEKKQNLPNITRLREEGAYRKMRPTFPSVTCSVQASLLSGKPPADHGIIGNGYFDRLTMRPEFWRQENALVNGPRIWDIMKERNVESKIAVLFWQNSKYINADVVVTPSPLHTDSGMIEWCYSKPSGLYQRLVEELGPFHLRDYWGPLASAKSSDWIAQASFLILKSELPDMLLVYIPHLDYVCQRFEPNSTKVEQELTFVDGIVGKFVNFKEEYGRDNISLFVISEYGFVPVKNAVCPNIILREHGLLKVQEIVGGEYIDFEQSGAFAVVDHQTAHIYCRKNMVESVRNILTTVKHISSVFDREEQRKFEIHHPRSGDLIALTNKDSWFAYYYWFDEKKAPFYANTVDIHNKPGYDPCELFIDPETKKIPIKPEFVRGSHGLPAETDEQLGVMICSDKKLDDYVPKSFHAIQFLGLLDRVM